MNTLSKVLAVLCVLLSAVVYAKWDLTAGSAEQQFPPLSPNPTLATGDAGVSVATSADGKIVYYSCARRLYKSTDGGLTWFILK
jgi:hypothetical protein